MLILASCSPPPEPPGVDTLSGEEPGDPLPGLGAEAVARFERGRALFGAACGDCHGVVGRGGPAGEEGDVHTPERPDAEACDLLWALPLWGRGMVEAVADGTLLEMEDPDDMDGDGISGTVGRDVSGRIGRFGVKADVADLGRFVQAEAFPDPSAADAVVDYMRLLALPGRILPTDDTEMAQVAQGERRFHEVGCAACHVPTLPTGPHGTESLSNVRVPLYSDVLLHDLGDAGANPCSQVAAPAEFRTALLLGVALRDRYMHDGRAATVDEAIAGHGGEGALSRDAFNDLPESERRALVAFVLSL